MEKNTINFMDAAQALRTCRARLKSIKDQEMQARVDFAFSIMLDSIEQPSRVLRLDKCWRLTGEHPAIVERMVSDFIRTSEHPAFSGLKCQRLKIKLRYAELDEGGNPTGGTPKKTQLMPVIINLGAVVPPRDGEGETREDFKEPVMGWDSLIEKYEGCKPEDCPYMKEVSKCPYSTPQKWRCPRNLSEINDLIDKIVEQG